jgi:beta-galactosidase
LIRVDFRMIASDLKDKKLPFGSINVMLGSKRYFEEKDKSVVWLPEKPYTPNSWGFEGGKSYVKRTRHGQLPASDLNILNTHIDPVFQTMRTGIKSFKLDVPDGEYTVGLYFAELMSRTVKVLAYNLGNDAIADDMEERIFSVDINGIRQIHNLNIAKEYGEQTAVIRKFVIQAKDGKGISIDFIPVKDEPILNAIRVYRNY